MNSTGFDPVARAGRLAGRGYRGRLAPSPTGWLHLGHARTFWIAQCRSQDRGGVLVLRDEDLDRSRCRPTFAAALIEDLRWFGFEWAEGPDCGGPHQPYRQSARHGLYWAALGRLIDAGAVYPCGCSRQDVLRAAQAPHAADDEPIYPGTCRPPANAARAVPTAGRPVHWRFRVDAGRAVEFDDGGQGRQRFVAGADFGDFIVWRQDGVPSYQLACVVDDAAMRITEVVRGADLLRSTARQILLYRALGLPEPAFYHCPLLTDTAGVRLAKRHDALSLRALRAQGWTPLALRERWDETARMDAAVRCAPDRAGLERQ
jgi:glutamyl-tRNA synthetase